MEAAALVELLPGGQIPGGDARGPFSYSWPWAYAFHKDYLVLHAV